MEAAATLMIFIEFHVGSPSTTRYGMVRRTQVVSCRKSRPKNRLYTFDYPPAGKSEKSGIVSSELELEFFHCFKFLPLKIMIGIELFASRFCWKWRRKRWTQVRSGSSVRELSKRQHSKITWYILVPSIFLFLFETYPRIRGVLVPFSWISTISSDLFALTPRWVKRCSSSGDPFDALMVSVTKNWSVSRWTDWTKKSGDTETPS